MILKRRPKRCFNAVICYCLMSDGGILLLHKKDDNKMYPSLWGVPGGKVDPGEDLWVAMAREIEEETGNKVSAEQLTLIAATYHRHKIPGGGYARFKCHTFFLKEKLPKVKLSKEHQDYRTVMPKRFLRLDPATLIEDELEVFRIIRKKGMI